VAEWQARDGPFVVDVHQSMRELSQRIVIETMFGREYVERTRGACAAWTTISDYVGRTFLTKHPIPLVVPTPANRRYVAAVRELDAAVFHMIESCKRGEASGTLLSSLVAALQRGDMERSSVRDEVTNMFLAGQESVSAALTWTWYLLSRTPAVQSEIERELMEVAPGSFPSFDQLNALEYLTRVIQEVLRLYPPGWLIDRVARQDDHVGGYHIPARSMVLVSQFVSHRLPHVWRNPEEFDPDRFALPGFQVNPYIYFPWGIGQHLCYGRTFAMMELKLIIAAIARSFTLTLRPGVQSIEAVPGITFRPRHGLPMLVSKDRDGRVESDALRTPVVAP
jgi:cytochrome P450